MFVFCKGHSVIKFFAIFVFSKAELSKSEDIILEYSQSP